MSPLLLANWREINRIFCTIVWIVALVLVAVIAGHLAGASSGCLSRQPFRSAAPCQTEAPQAAASHPMRRRAAAVPDQVSENGG